MDYRWTYKSSAAAFADLVSRVPIGRWDAPGLGDWSLRDLIGHTVSSALRQVPAVLAAPGTAVRIDSPEGYWAYARTAPPDLYAAAVTASSEDARQTGESLGDAPADPIRDLIRQATQALAAAGDADVVNTPVGGMRVRDWMPTRTFELVVHGMDIAGAAGVEVEFAAQAVKETTALAAQIAAATGDGPLLLRALTGRAVLPNGFSVV